MIRYGVQEEIDAYFEHPGLNQSYLKDLLRGVDYIGEDEKKMFYEEKGHFIIGNGVDITITQGGEYYKKKTHVMSENKPSAAIMSIVQMVFEVAVLDGLAPESEIVDYSEFILESCDAHVYYMNRKPETRINGIVTEGREYFKELQESAGKQLVSQRENTIINNSVMGLRTGSFTAKYFQDSPDVDIFFQVPIYFTYNGEVCKCLIDMLRVDRKHRILSSYDIKTTGGPVKYFPSSVGARGYNIQGSFYLTGLKQLADKNDFSEAVSTPIIELGDISGYMVHPFRFLVETTTFTENKMTGEIVYHQGNPLIFKLSHEQIKIGQFGRPALNIKGSVDEDMDYPGTIREIHYIKYKEIRGFDQAIMLHRWHKNQGFEFDKEVMESMGEILIE